MILFYIIVYNIVNIVVGVDVEVYVCYLKNFDMVISWYFIVDDIEIYQYLFLNENGWYVGDGNGSGNWVFIGIEICENIDGDFV